MHKTMQSVLLALSFSVSFSSTVYAQQSSTFANGLDCGVLQGSGQTTDPGAEQECPGTGSANNGGGGFDPGSLPAPLGSTLQLPADPDIVRDIEVWNASQFDAAALRPGTRVIVKADINEPVYVGASDIEIRNEAFVKDLMLCETEAGCTGKYNGGNPIPVGQSIHRIRLEGGKYGSIMFPRPHGEEGRYVTDVTMNRIRVERGVGLRGKRIAIYRSDLRSTKYALSSFHNEPLQSTDIIVACTVLSSFAPDGVKNEATMRLMNVKRTVLVDSVLQNGKQSNWTDTAISGIRAKHTYRIHKTSDLNYAARNTFLNSGVMFGDYGHGSARVGTMWFVDNVWYNRSGGWFKPKADNGGTIDKVITKGNKVYITGAATKTFWRSQGDRDSVGTVVDENNQMLEFQFPPNGWVN